MLPAVQPDAVGQVAQGASVKAAGQHHAAADDEHGRQQKAYEDVGDGEEGEGCMEAKVERHQAEGRDRRQGP